MHTPLRVLAANVIAIHSPLRRRRRKPDRMAAVVPSVERLYTLDELTELRRNTLRYARFFLPATSATIPDTPPRVRSSRVRAGSVGVALGIQRAVTVIGNQQPVGLFLGQEPHQHTVTYFIA